MVSRDLSGRVAIVTGGGSGMGDATARLFAEQGAAVVVADINCKNGEETAEAIRATGGRARFVQADVSNEAAVEAMIAFAVEEFGRLDCAVNNAARHPDCDPIELIDMEVFDEVIAVNLRSVVLCLKYELQQMLKQGSPGSIVNIASISGLRPQPGNPAYIAAKSGVIGLTKSASLDYAPKGIRVNCVAPGLVETPMIAAALEGTELARNSLASSISLFGRFGQPHEVAEANLWLCSDKSSLVTGATLAVDAGYTSM